MERGGMDWGVEWGNYSADKEARKWRKSGEI